MSTETLKLGGLRDTGLRYEIRATVRDTGEVKVLGWAGNLPAADHCVRTIARSVVYYDPHHVDRVANNTVPA